MKIGKLEVPDECPKCGEYNNWTGPFYDSFLAKLLFTCVNCRYREVMKPLDYKEVDLDANKKVKIDAGEPFTSDDWLKYRKDQDANK